MWNANGGWPSRGMSQGADALTLPKVSFVIAENYFGNVINFMVSYTIISRGNR